MTRSVAFLRGINVGGRRVKNDELCRVFESIGLTEVSAILASGIVLFESSESAASLEPAISAGLTELIGSRVPTFLRSAAEVNAISSLEAFSEAELAETAGNVQVVMLATPPKRSTRDEALAYATPDDLLVIENRELYWLPRNGISDSSLDVRGLENTLGPMTIRTRRTITRLVAKLT
jgi:uncharacterized protein (DUF1697 family)